MIIKFIFLHKVNGIKWTLPPVLHVLILNVHVYVQEREEGGRGGGRREGGGEGRREGNDCVYIVEHYYTHFPSNKHRFCMYSDDVKRARE